MNLSTVVGLAAGFFFIIVAIVLGGDISRYLEAQSIMIVLGGTMAATIASYSFEQLKQFLPMLKKAFVKPSFNMHQDLDRIVELANVARREGLLALDGEDLGDPFMQKGIEMVVDGTDPELVKDIMETEIDQSMEHDMLGQTVMRSVAQYAPAFGMTGTLIGLINMLAFLDDVETLGPSMATALLTTFYGVVLANLVALPFANKLKAASDLKMLRYEMLLEGILSIQNGENPRIIREKLNVFAMSQPGVTPLAETEEEEGAQGSAQEAFSE